MNNNQSGSRREKGADEDWLRDLRISIHGAPRLAPEPWPVRIDDPFAGRVIDGIANPHMGIIPKAESLRKFKEGMGEVVEKLAEIADNFGKPDSQRVELPDRIITPYIRHAALEALKHLTSSSMTQRFNG